VSGQLPEDINDLSKWPDDFSNDDELLGRSDELSLATFRHVLLEELIRAYDISEIAQAHAKTATSAIEKIQWLQEPLYALNLWEEDAGYYGLDRWGELNAHDDELLALMWNITDIVTELPDNPAITTQLLRELMKDLDIWNYPLAPAAIVAIKPVEPAAINEILDNFCSSFHRDEEGSLIHDSDLAWFFPLPITQIADATPLIAILALHPDASVDLVKKVAEICLINTSSQKLKTAFWGYIITCLSNRGPDVFIESLPCHYELWATGFFGIGLPQSAPQIGGDQLRVLTTTFAAHHKIWNQADYAQSFILSDTALLLAGRPELSSEILQELVLLALPEVCQAIITNPSASDETKALAAKGRGTR